MSLMSPESDNKPKLEFLNYVKLNIGGALFYTTISTLSKLDSKLRDMVLTEVANGSPAETDGGMPRSNGWKPTCVLWRELNFSTGWVFIDRCGKHFGTILNFLRDGSVPLPETCVEISEILTEAKYYGVTELYEACEQALQKKRKRNTNITWVTLITSQNEAQKLISISTKVTCFSSLVLLSFDFYIYFVFFFSLWWNLQLIDTTTNIHIPGTVIHSNL